MIVGGELLRQALEQAQRNVERDEWPERDPNKWFPVEPDEDQEPEQE